MTRVEIEVYGAEDIARVAARVRQLGNGREIPNAMAKRIRGAVPPIRKAVRSSALSTLPGGGGLNAWVAKAGVRASIRRGPRNAGISLVSGRRSQGGRSDIQGINAGSTRHPSWGRRGAGQWHPQAVAPGFFDRAVEGEGLTAFRREVNSAIGIAVQEVGLG